MNDGEIEPCIAYIRDSNGAQNCTVSPEADMINKIDSHGHSEAFINQNGDVEEDESGWETAVSHLPTRIPGIVMSRGVQLNGKKMHVMKTLKCSGD
ncbi:hypothetical protein NC651_003596 [Populus alba x Populus x berolinensis]|nr:hypothetical protein NC651_003596 [Populus alba x Populus x berolinensis]